MKTILNPIQRLPLILTAVLLLPFAAGAQSVLDKYVADALESNLVLQQKTVSLQQAQNGLQTARSYFLPTVTLLADYTSGDGGRSIAIPVGDLLNPVYTTLNQLTESNSFPQIKNAEQNFFPKNFYDARVRTTLPVVNTDLHLSRSIQSQQVLLRKYEIEAYKRELILDIKTAYYNLLAADASVRIYQSALALVNKNVEVNSSLLRNGKALPANLRRSESEVEKVKAELNLAENKKRNGERYLNFLLNRDLSSAVEIDLSIVESQIVESGRTESTDIRTREELKIISTLQQINQSTLLMNKLGRVPKVNAFLDLGSQAYNFQVNDKSKYYLFGVQMSLPLFQGFRTNMNIRQSQLAIQKTTQQLSLTEGQLELAIALAIDDAKTAAQNFQASRKQLEAAESYFNLVDRGYREGVHPLIEFLDARNQLTSSQLQQAVRKFEWLIAEARVERETASYNINNQ